MVLSWAIMGQAKKWQARELFYLDPNMLERKLQAHRYLKYHFFKSDHNLNFSKIRFLYLIKY